MRSIFAGLLLLVAFSVVHDVQAQQYIQCNTQTQANCNTSNNPGNGQQGDPAWLSFGKTNANFQFIAPLWSLGGNQLIGSQGAGTLVPITIGANLSLSAGVLSAIGGGTVTAATITVPSPLNSGACTGITILTCTITWGSGTIPSANIPAINLAGTGAGGVTGTLPIADLGAGALPSGVTTNGGSAPVGTSDTQTLTNKALNASSNSLTGTASGLSIGGNAATATSATTAGSATTATTATNVAGGAAGSVPYQTAAGATALLPEAPGVLVGGTTPDYSTAPTLTGTNFTGVPAAGLTGTLQAAQEPAHTGDVTNTAGSLATTVGKVNNGAIPTSTSVVGTNSFGQLIQATGALPAAVTTTGGSAPVGTSDTQTLTNKSIVASQLTGTLQAAQEPAHTGDATNTAGSLALTVSGIHGAAVPTSAPLLGTNSSGQPLSVTALPAGVTTNGGSAPVGTSDTQTLTGKTISGASNTITNLPATALPALTGDVTSSAGSAATTVATGAVTDAKASLAVKPPVGLAAVANLTLSGAQTIDGVTGTAGTTLVLATAQTTTSQNGPWIMQTGAWTRPAWYPSGGTTQAFQFIETLVRLGTTYQGSIWRQTAAGPITIDTTATTWAVTPTALNASTVAGNLPLANLQTIAGGYILANPTGSAAPPIGVNALPSGVTAGCVNNTFVGLQDFCTYIDASNPIYAGGVNTANADNTAAINAACGAAPTAHTRAIIAPGHYNFTGQLSYTVDRSTCEGSGQNITVFNYTGTNTTQDLMQVFGKSPTGPTGNGFVGNFSITSSTVMTSGCAIHAKYLESTYFEHIALNVPYSSVNNLWNGFCDESMNQNYFDKAWITVQNDAERIYGVGAGGFGVQYAFYTNDLYVAKGAIGIHFCGGVDVEQGNRDEITSNNVNVQIDNQCVPTGIATSGSTTTLVDTARSWNLGTAGTGEWAGQQVRITTAGIPYITTITSNTANTFTFPAIGVAVAAGSTYAIINSGGAATSGTTTTLVDSSQSWTSGAWVGDTINYYDSGTLYSAIVTASTATSVTFAAQAAAPSSGDTYYLTLWGSPANQEILLDTGFVQDQATTDNMVINDPFASVTHYCKIAANGPITHAKSGNGINVIAWPGKCSVSIGAPYITGNSAAGIYAQDLTTRIQINSQTDITNNGTFGINTAGQDPYIQTIATIYGNPSGPMSFASSWGNWLPGGVSSNLTGNQNYGFGNNSFGSLNSSATTANDTVFGGYDAFLNITSGTANVGFGQGAFKLGTSLAHDVGVGYLIGAAVTSGAEYSMLGDQVGSVVCTTGNHVLLLGTSSATDCSSGGETNAIHIGSNGTDIIKSTGTSTPATSVTTIAGIVGTGGFTIGGLPTCNSSTNIGQFAYVTNGVASPTYFATPSTTGTSDDPVFCAGASGWVYH